MYNTQCPLYTIHWCQWSWLFQPTVRLITSSDHSVVMWLITLCILSLWPTQAPGYNPRVIMITQWIDLLLTGLTCVDRMITGQPKRDHLIIDIGQRLPDWTTLNLIITLLVDIICVPKILFYHHALPCTIMHYLTTVSKFFPITDIATYRLNLPRCQFIWNA